MSDQCLFCQPTFQDSSLYANEAFYIQPDQNPVNPGHLLIIPKRHIATYFEQNELEASLLKETIDQAQQLCKSPALKEFYEQTLATTSRPITKEFCQLALDNWDRPITGYNLGINNGLTAGQTIMHLHIHLIPRFEGDVTDPTGGVRFVIPDRGNYRQ